jgi:hypothetical protein
MRVPVREKITYEEIWKQIGISVNELKQLPSQDYVLVTTLSMQRPKKLETIEFDGNVFRFTDELPRPFTRERLDLIGSQKPPNDLPKDFTVVHLAIKARTEFEAFDASMDSLDYLRGIWNFLLNFPTLIRHYSGSRKPVNMIRPGPVHSLHRPTGECFSDLYWYEPLLAPESKAEKLDTWEQIEEKQHVMASALIGHSYQLFMKDLFIRYARALDSCDYQVAFLKLWSLLEHCTRIKLNENNGDVINRTLFLFEDHEYHRQVLEHLRERRNASVHHGESSSEDETHIYQLKKYVEWTISFHLHSGEMFNSADEAGELLKCARSPHELNKQIEDLKFRIRLREQALSIHAKTKMK